MPKRTNVGGFPYRRLCELAEETGAVIKLAHEEYGWGITVSLGCDGSSDLPRAAGYIFGSLDELEKHACWLLTWLSATAMELKPPETLL